MDSTDPKRPDPDLLLKSLNEENERDNKGKLKIFFGMCAGVGKTYSMLEAAQKIKKEGIDIVVGIVETHKRIETEKLLEGLERIDQKKIEYHGATFVEMNLDSILSRKPKLVLVDELAHSNIPGSRHAKRYQDVLEILYNGIDVYTTLNVQHLESRTEIVRQITGTKIRETVPDSIFDRANDIEIVDITPDELLKRFVEGKVYTPERSMQAINNFFRKENITALREMTLRLLAERIDWQLRDYPGTKKLAGTWKSHNRIMVAFSASPSSLNLIQWTRRLAYSMEASWLAVYVDSGLKISDEIKEQLIKNFNLARELGAEVITTTDSDVVTGLIRVAKENNISQIIVGKPLRKFPLDFIFKKDISKKLINASENLDIYVVGDIPHENKLDFRNLITLNSNLMKYFFVFLSILLTGSISYILLDEKGYQTVSLIFLFVISLLPLFGFGPGPILFAAFLSAISWDFFFIPPQYTLHIDKIEDVLMLFMYFIVAMVTGFLSAKVRSQQNLVRQREHKANALYNLTKKLSEANNIDEIASISIENIGQVFEVDVLLIFSDKNNHLSSVPHPASRFILNETEWGVVQWVFNNRQIAGRYSNTISLANATYYPMLGKVKTLGVIGIKTKNNKQLTLDQQFLFDTFIKQISTSLEREYLNELAKESYLLNESEKLYKTLFDSISHELKTPITTILSGVNGIQNEYLSNSSNVAKSLVEEINIAANRLNLLVENLLDMARLESGIIKPKLDWYDIKDVIQTIFLKLRDKNDLHKITIKINEDVHLFRFDFILIEQALLNIIRNSILYSFKDGEIIIEAHDEDNYCIITISDSGPGLPDESLSKIFNKFYRVPGTKTGGTGLGLSIAKGFIEAHNGTIEVKNKKEHGVIFTIKIPMNIL